MKKIVFTIYVFIIGYFVGTQHIPTGVDVLILLSIAFYSGIWMHDKYFRIARKLSTRKVQRKRTEALSASPAASLTLIKTEDACDFCNGDEVTIGKQQIPCPKCKAEIKKRKKAENS